MSFEQTICPNCRVQVEEVEDDPEFPYVCPDCGEFWREGEVEKEYVHC